LEQGSVFPHNLIVHSEFVAPAFLRWHSGRARRLSGRHLAFPLLIVFICAAVLSVPAGTKTKPSLSFASRTDGARPDRVRSDRASGRVSDRGYTSALAAANRFLQAWQSQDHETGLLMLTDDAKQHSSEEHMEMFFSSSSSGGTDGAYEIARGKKMKAGRYVFPVRLFPVHSDTTRFDHPQKSEIVVVRTGKDEWAVDRLP
jgi:hypothetical protein